MKPEILIDAVELSSLLKINSDNIFIFDCRFDIANSATGRNLYLDGHIPHARYVSLDDDLSGPKNPLQGRHPLPSPQKWYETKVKLGINKDSNMILYDDLENTYSARMWWMLVNTGHSNIRLLNGGYQAWLRSGGDIEVGEHSEPMINRSSNLTVQPFLKLITMQDVYENIHSRQFIVLDARAANRYHGENETLDPVAGHIPNALNRPYKLNLTENGLFKAAEELAKDFANFSHENIVHQCGSGVTACNNLLAMEIAGLSGSKLYAGSWSEWCQHSSNPIEINQQ